MHGTPFLFQIDEGGRRGRTEAPGPFRPFARGLQKVHWGGEEGDDKAESTTSLQEREGAVSAHTNDDADDLSIEPSIYVVGV